MKYGVSSYLWVSPLTDKKSDVLNKVKSMGFDFFEIAVETPASFNPGYIKDKADALGLKINVCGAFGLSRDISSSDKKIQKEAIDYLRTCIDYAEIMGAEYFAGPMYAVSGVAYLKTDSEKKRQMARIVNNLKFVADYAGNKGIKLALEPLNRFETDVINTVDQGLELFEKVGFDNLGFLLDVFHMNIEEKNIPAAIEKADKRLFDFHACGNDRGIPGEDHLDWDGIKKAFSKIGYTGAVVIESFSSEIKEIAKSTALWRAVAPDTDTIARKGLEFLKTKLG